MGVGAGAVALAPAVAVEVAGAVAAATAVAAAGLAKVVVVVVVMVVTGGGGDGGIGGNVAATTNSPGPYSGRLLELSVFTLVDLYAPASAGGDSGSGQRELRVWDG